MSPEEVAVLTRHDTLVIAVRAVERETNRGCGIVVPSPYRCAQIAIEAAIAHVKEVKP
jgi:hypothetical protein